MELIEVSRAYRCPHCRKLYQLRHAAERHERHCWFNGNRQPRLGEITHDGTHDMLMDWDGDGKAPWYPGERGLCYTEDGWQPVPGYEFGKRFGNSEDWPDVTICGPGFGGGPNDPETYGTEFTANFKEIGRRERIEYWDDFAEAADARPPAR